MKIAMIKCLWAVRSIIYKLRFGNIGVGGYFGKPTYISGTRNIFIGNKVRVFPGARMETIKGGKITIDNDVSIGQNLHIVSGQGEIKIGTRTTISGNVFISNVSHNFEVLGCHIMEQNLTYRETCVGENCFLGYGSVILDGAKLGKQCIVGANAVVRAGDYPDYSVLVGIPARVVKKYDKEKEQWVKCI